MPLWTRLVSVWRTIAGGDRLDAELDAELASAVEELAARRVRDGEAPEAARRAARLALGGLQQVKEATRDERVGARVETLVADVRHAVRTVRRARGLSVAVVATLALGIGANTAIFSVVKALLLDPLPYRDAGRLVFVWANLEQAGYPRAPLAGPELADFRERCASFDGLGAIWANTVALTGDGDPEQLRIGLVTPDFFSVLGAEAALGRTFGPEEDTPAPSRAILLSWELWERRYGGDPGVVGGRIEVNGAPVTVVGVMPRDFRLWMPADANVPDDLQAWLPFGRGVLRGPRGQQFLRVVGRLKAGVTVDQADAEVASVGRAMVAEFPDYAASPPTFFAVSLEADGVREVRPALVALFGGVTLLLAMACVNVANLLVARAAARRREIALRMALGASRWRLVRQAVLEGLVLAGLGGAAGLVVAAVGVDLLVSLRPDGLNRLATARLDPGVLAFTAAAALGWGLLFSLAPSAEVVRTVASTGLRPSSGGRVAGGRAEARVRRALVLTQVALGFVLLVSAGLLLHAFVRLSRVDLGFEAAPALTFRVAPPASRYRSPGEQNAFGLRLREELARLPGVTGVGAVSHLPFDNLPNWSTPYVREDAGDRPVVREADARTVTPGYFEAIGATLVDGRWFSEADDAGTLPVAIVDERFAERTWPGAGAVGRRVFADPPASGAPTELVTVVGVVRHLRHRTPSAEVREQMYFPQRQVRRSPMGVVVRSGADPAELAAAVREVVSGLDPQLPVYDVRPLADYLDRALAVPRFTTLLATLFAAAALALAVVGVYGVLAYSVTRRRSEFAIRLALGAGRPAVAWLVVREAGGVAAAGLTLGLAGSIAAAGPLRAQLYELTPGDPVTYGAAIAALVVAVAAAALLPALRATGVRALESLRAE